MFWKVGGIRGRQRKSKRNEAPNESGKKDAKSRGDIGAEANERKRYTAQRKRPKLRAVRKVQQWKLLINYKSLKGST